MKFKTLIPCVLLVNMSLIHADEIKKEKLVLIQKMMETLGVKARMNQIMGTAISSEVDEIIKKNPDISDSMKLEIKKTIANVFLNAMEGADGLYSQLYGIYDKYMDEDDLKAVIDFYSSGSGKKFIEISPKMLQESMQIGKEWYQKLLPVLTESLKEKFKNKNLKMPDRKS